MTVQKHRGDIMYNPQITVERIKNIRKSKKMPSYQLNEVCNLNKNTIAVSANSKNGLSAQILYDVSETLDCSVDYLLGRSDNPNVNNNPTINTGDIRNISGNHNTIASVQNGRTSELLEMIEKLSIVEQAEVILFIDKIKKGKNTNE